LVEHNVANVVVVGSNPITRSFEAVDHQLSAVGHWEIMISALAES
jgi:hypothetical protein